MTWGIVSDIDCDWADNKKDAINRAKEFETDGASYCFIQKHDGEKFVGDCVYIVRKGENNK